MDFTTVTGAEELHAVIDSAPVDPPMRPTEGVEDFGAAPGQMQTSEAASEEL